MRSGTLAFRPSLIPTLAAAAMVALTLWLAHWQTRRGDEKAARQALLESRVAAPVLLLGRAGQTSGDIIFRRVSARGTYDAPAQLFIDNRQSGGRAGFHVITPLVLAGGDVVLVNRGWVARTADYPAAPPVPVPPGEQHVEGLAVLPPQRFLELSPHVTAGNVWQNLSLERYAEKSPRPVVPVVILVAEPGLVPVEERPDAGEAKHREYALTWLSLAITTVALWIGLNVRRVRG